MVQESEKSRLLSFYLSLIRSSLFPERERKRNKKREREKEKQEEREREVKKGMT